MVDARKMVEEILDHWCFDWEGNTIRGVPCGVMPQAKLTCVENKYRKLLWLNHGAHE